MLVLSRYPEQSIRIGDNIIVTIVNVRGNRVKVGVEAPEDFPVHRSEIYDEIHNENVVEQSKKNVPFMDHGNASNDNV